MSYIITRPAYTFNGCPTVPAYTLELPDSEEAGVLAEVTTETVEISASLRAINGALTVDYFGKYRVWTLNFAKLDYELFCLIRDELHCIQMNNHINLLLTITNDCATCPEITDVPVRLRHNEETLNASSCGGKYISDFQLILEEIKGCDE